MKSEREVIQSCPTLRDPMDCSPRGSSIHGIFQARVLEWGAIAFSDMLVYKDLITMVDIKRVVLPSEKAKVVIELSYQKVIK